MNMTRHLLIGLTMAALGLSGAAQARADDGRGGMQRDGSWVEQHGGRRGDRCDSEWAGRGRHDHRHDALHRIDARQDRQRHRIREGWRSGELTRGEARHLRREQRHIAKMERRYTADGHLSGKERRRLERALDRASRHIYRAKHNHHLAYRSHVHRYDRW